MRAPEDAAHHGVMSELVRTSRDGPRQSGPIHPTAGVSLPCRRAVAYRSGRRDSNERGGVAIHVGLLQGAQMVAPRGHGVKGRRITGLEQQRGDP
jgi:hypothetical protein